MVTGFWRQVVAALLAIGTVIAAAQASSTEIPTTMSTEATRFLEALYAANIKANKAPARLIWPLGAACKTIWPPTTHAPRLRGRCCRSWACR